MLDQLIEDNLNSELEGIIFGNKLITDENVSRLVFVDCVKQKEAKEFIEVFNKLTDFKHTTVWGVPFHSVLKVSYLVLIMTKIVILMSKTC